MFKESSALSIIKRVSRDSFQSALLGVNTKTNDMHCHLEEPGKSTSGPTESYGSWEARDSLEWGLNVTHAVSAPFSVYSFLIYKHVWSGLSDNTIPPCNELQITPNETFHLILTHSLHAQQLIIKMI